MLTAPNVIRKELLAQYSQYIDEYKEYLGQYERMREVLNTLTDQNIEEVWEQLGELDIQIEWSKVGQEFRNNFDQVAASEAYSGRHYEGDLVAVQINGNWVGYPHYYGGGKWGEPESIDWIDDAVFLKATETTKVVYEFEIIK